MDDFNNFLKNTYEALAGKGLDKHIKVEFLCKLVIEIKKEITADLRENNVNPVIDASLVSMFLAGYEYAKNMED